jgi:hypothetical protein
VEAVKIGCNLARSLMKKEYCVWIVCGDLGMEMVREVSVRVQGNGCPCVLAIAILLLMICSVVPGCLWRGLNFILVMLTTTYMAMTVEIKCFLEVHFDEYADRSVVRDHI